jgi:hypothetical protein
MVSCSMRPSTLSSSSLRVAGHESAFSVHLLKRSRAALWPQFPLSLIRRSGVILKMLTGIWNGLGLPIGLPLVGGLARLVGILAGLACFGVVLYLYLGHSYALHLNGLSRSDSVLLCRIAANERIYVEGCQD